MKNKIGTACMALGAALILTALSLFVWNYHEAKRAAERADAILPDVLEALGAEEATYPNPFDAAMTEVKIDGFFYIGYLSIPVLDLELPVMSEWDYDRLKIAPCRYAGSTKTDDLVIAAHNYSRHFGALKTLEPGDMIYFTDMDGMAGSYAVAELDVLNPTDVEKMTSGDYDLTLFTCTYGGKSRITVRCDRAED